LEVITRIVRSTS